MARRQRVRRGVRVGPGPRRPRRARRLRPAARPPRSARDPLRAGPRRPRIPLGAGPAPPPGALPRPLPRPVRGPRARPRDGLRGVPPAAPGRRDARRPPNTGAGSASRARRLAAVARRPRGDRPRSGHGAGRERLPGLPRRGAGGPDELRSLLDEPRRLARARRAPPRPGPDRPARGRAAGRRAGGPAPGRRPVPRLPPLRRAGPGGVRPGLPRPAGRPGRPAGGPEGLGRRGGRDARPGAVAAHQRRARSTRSTAAGRSRRSACRTSARPPWPTPSPT